MDSSPFYEQNRMETTSSQPRGGCFSAVLTPLIVIFLVAMMFQLVTGDTTEPWEIRITINEFPASAHAAAGANSDTTPNHPSLTPLFAPSVLFWEADILRWAAQAELDPNLVATVMQIESCGDPRALSPAGAMGLFQVMPYHFKKDDSPYQPDTNASRGLAYLKESLSTHQNVRLALAGYNGGIGTASKPEHQWPKETIRYAYWSIGIYQDATQGAAFSPRLDEWFAAGGASLCRQAEQRLGLQP
jgi:hypothetical protein